MENHPIPQDVTGFKFKLIGSITVKQFLYLLGGGILAVLFVFVFPLPFYLKFPFAIFFGGMGASLAFIPIDGRPMDKMMMQFIKTIPSENEYLYHKRGVDLSLYEFFKPPAQVHVQPQNQQVSQDMRRQVLFTQFGGSTIQPDEGEKQLLQNVHDLFTNDATLPIQPQNAAVQVAAAPVQKMVATPSATPVKLATSTIPVVEENKRTQTAVPPPLVSTVQTTSSHTTITTTSSSQTSQPNPSIAFEQAQTNAASRVEEDKKQQESLEKISKEVEKQKQQSQQTNAQSSHTVNVLSQSQNQFNAGFPTLPDVPNIILGVIKDARGKVLPNILVEVVDTQNTPVRAFKTNPLGQFAAATPLQPGTYKLFFEDPQKNHEFDTINITLNNQIFQPLEIISVDQREKLRRELFGN